MEDRIVFIDNQPYELFRGDESAKLYEERCLPSADINDVVVTSLPINREYIAYLQTLGLKIECDFFTPQFFYKDLAYSILNDDRLLSILKRKVRESNYVIETFIPNRDLVTLSRYLNIPILFPQDIYDKYSSKIGFNKLAKILKLPHPDNVFFSHGNLCDYRHFIKRNQDVLLKKNNTIGSLGVYDISSNQILKKIVKQYPTDLFLLEKKIEAVWNGSIQFIFQNNNPRIFIDECSMDNNHFKGFKYPATFPEECHSKIKDYAELIASFLKQYFIRKGYFGLDFIVSNTNDIFFHDFNPRKTGVIYVLFFIEKLIGIIDNYNLKIASTFINLDYYNRKAIDFLTVITLLRRNKILFGQLSGYEGILLFNPNLLKMKILHVISLSQIDNEDIYIREVKKILSNQVNNLL